MGDRITIPTAIRKWETYEDIVQASENLTLIADY